MKFKVSLLLVFVAFLLAGCTLFKGVEGPSWYNHPQRFVSEGKVAFVSEGTASTQRQAELIAYSNLQEKIELFIGSDLDKEQYRRLTTINSIEEFGLTIDNTYSENDKNGSYTVMLMAVGSKDKLLYKMSEQAKIDAEKADKVMKLVLEGDELIKKNQDLAGISKYLQSMVLSFGLASIDKEFSFSEIENVVEEMLNTIKISLSDIDKDNASCIVSVRKKGLIYSNVKKGNIKASYLASDSDGEVYSDSFEYLTSENGTFNYEPIDYSLAREGRIVFSFGFDDELKEIEKINPITADKLRRVIDKNSVAFSYSRKYKKGPIAVCGMRFDEDGDFIEAIVLTDSLKDRFDANYAVCKAYYGSGDMEDEVIITTVSKDYPGIEYLLIYKAAKLDSMDSSATNVFVVSVEGKAQLYKISNASLVYETEVLYTNGFGNSYEEAEQNAFEEMTQLIYSQVRVVYV